MEQNVNGGEAVDSVSKDTSQETCLWTKGKNYGNNIFIFIVLVFLFCLPLCLFLISVSLSFPPCFRKGYTYMKELRWFLSQRVSEVTSQKGRWISSKADAAEGYKLKLSDEGAKLKCSTVQFRFAKIIVKSGYCLSIWGKRCTNLGGWVIEIHQPEWSAGRTNDKGIDHYYCRDGAIPEVEPFKVFKKSKIWPC